VAALGAGAAVAVVLLSGGSAADPRTPAALPGLPPPFLGTVVVGSGGMTAAIDAYGDVVDLRAPGPAGRALIDNPAARQTAGSVPAATGIVPRVEIGGTAPQPFWRADSVSQRYLRGTNVVRTVARFGAVRVVVAAAATEGALAQTLRVVAPGGGTRAAPSLAVDVEPGVHCGVRRAGPYLGLVCGRDRGGEEARVSIRQAVVGDRRWLAQAAALGSAAPAWAGAMYRRSLLTLRALSDSGSGAVAAGARDGWAYVWPRDAGAVALAFAASGLDREARRVAGFLLRLELGAAARFRGDGSAVAGRPAQGDAAGWVAAAARSAGLPAPSAGTRWQGRADYQEGDTGSYLANAIASNHQVRAPAPGGEQSGTEVEGAGRQLSPFRTPAGLVREAGEAESGVDSAAAWAVRPFPDPSLFPAVRRSLLRLAAGASRFGIVPGEDWPGRDPWTAATAWSAWSLAALGDPRSRHAALSLLAGLRRAATPAGALPERVDARSGIPRSTTPLAWSHAFAILALRQLWPGRAGPPILAR
jgi:glucoamylase